MLEKRPIIGEARDRELLKDASTFAYKKIDSGELHAHVFLPHEMNPQEKYPVLIFFHGGFWEVSTPAQFAPHCLHFADKNFVTIAAETRIMSKNQCTIQDVIEDSQDLILAVKNYAYTLGVDTEKITLIGAAGGSLPALHAAMAKEVKTVGNFDARPAAVVALSSLLDLSSCTESLAKISDAKIRKSLSPVNMIRKNMPPIKLIHGKADRIIPVKPISSFQFWMKWKKSPLDVVLFDGADHHFYNFNLTSPYYDLTLNSIENFIAEKVLTSENSR